MPWSNSRALPEDWRVDGPTPVCGAKPTSFGVVDSHPPITSLETSDGASLGQTPRHVAAFPMSLRARGSRRGRR